MNSKVLKATQITFTYGDKMTLTIEGLEAEKFAEWFFGDNNRLKMFNWNIKQHSNPLKKVSGLFDKLLGNS